MSRTKPTLGYPSRSAAALALREGQNLKHDEIAALIGVSPNAVGNLIRHARQQRADANDDARIKGISRRVREHLRSKARRRGLTTRELIAMLLTVVVRDQLVDAVLDDAASERAPSARAARQESKLAVVSHNSSRLAAP